MSSVVTPDGPTEGVEIETTVDPLLAPIPLPETRKVKSKRQRRLQQQRHRRIELAGAGGIALAVLLIVGLVSAVATGHGPHRHNAPAAAPAKAVIPPVLLAQRDASGNAISLTVLVPAANNRGGALVLIPPGTMTEVASADLQPVGTTLADGGAARLQATVQNMLGVAMAETTVLDDAGITALVAPSGPLTVNVPERVEKVEPSGTVDVLYQAGPTKVAPEDVPRLLRAAGPGNDLARLARHQSFWEAWLARLHDQPSALPAQPPGLRRALAALVAGPVRTRLVPVTTIGTTTEDGELYKVDAGELSRMVADTFPGSKAGPAAARPTIQILNGTGVVGLAQRVQDKLGPSVEVKLTGNAISFSYATSQIVYYDRTKQAVAERVQKLLGVGQLVLSRNPIDVVDVTIVVGKDFT